MNPRLGHLQPYPFEKLRALVAGITPDTAYAAIQLQIGEPKHATPDFVKTALSAHEYPREVAFIDQMPMTTTGKVIRRLLRQRA